MAITVNRATLARQVNGEIEYIYPKTTADLVEYDSSQDIKEKIDDIVANAKSDLEVKVDKPLDEDGNIYNGTAGQVLETNGDGTTSWVSRAKVYVGTDEMPEGYDIKLDPNKVNINIDKSLTVEGSAADAKAVGDAIDNINDVINNLDMADKVDMPLDDDGLPYNGMGGQVLETNGDGTTSWVSRARVYVGSGDMPEEYDVQIDPDAEAIEIDRTLSVDGGIAEASAVGAAINNTKAKITSDIEAHNTDAAAHIDIRAMITDAKDFILLRDQATGDEYKVIIENGELKVINTVVRPVSIAITTMPTKTSYSVGEVFDPSDMVVTVSYDNNTTKVVDAYTYPTTKITANTTSIPITYIEAGVTVTTSVDITVVIECIGITISTPPTRTQYVEGQSFNPSGMIVAATYSDGTVVAVTNYTYPTTILTTDITTVLVTYVEDGKTFTANVIITVIAKKCTGIIITAQPTNREYVDGDVFNPAGMVVTANYNDGTSTVVSNYAYPTTGLVEGATTVVITYVDGDSTFTANVTITVVSGFDVTKVLQDFTYKTNANGTYTLTGWKGTLNGVPSTECVVPDSELIIVDP